MPIESSRRNRHPKGSVPEALAEANSDSPIEAATTPLTNSLRIVSFHSRAITLPFGEVPPMGTLVTDVVHADSREMTKFADRGYLSFSVISGTGTS